MEPTKRPFPLLLALLIAVLLAGLVGLIVLTASLSSQFKAAFQPLQQANAGLSTQVSQLLHPTPTLIPDPDTHTPATFLPFTLSRSNLCVPHSPER